MGEVYLYEARYRYSPEDHKDDPEFYIAIDPGDKLEVPEENLEKGPERPETWLRGSNVTKNTYGMFPGPYVSFLGVKSKADKPPELPPMPPTVAKKPDRVASQKSLDTAALGTDDGNYASFSPLDVKPQPSHATPTFPRTAGSTPTNQRTVGPPGVPHRLIDSFFLKPVVCFHCNDFIWGVGKIGKKCEACQKCYHDLCIETAIHNCLRDKPAESTTQERNVGVDEWSTSNVVDWMAALNLYRYAELFRDRGIGGKDLLKMDEDKLNVSESI